MIISGFGWVGASSSGRRQSVNSLTAPARLENSENLLAMYTFHPLQVKFCVKYDRVIYIRLHTQRVRLVRYFKLFLFLFKPDSWLVFAYYWLLDTVNYIWSVSRKWDLRHCYISTLYSHIGSTYIFGRAFIFIRFPILLRLIILYSTSFFA